MNAAIGKLLTQFDANGRAKSPPPSAAQDPGCADKAEGGHARASAAASAPGPTATAAFAAIRHPKAEAPPAGLLDDAYRRGHAAGVAEGDARLAEERVRSAIRLGEERAKWSDQQAVAIVGGFETACREIETNIASSWRGYCCLSSPTRSVTRRSDRWWSRLRR